MDLENFIRLVVVMFAVALFTVSAFLYLQKETLPATSAMGFVFLLVFVLTISNFRRIKGFGFEAEMWEDKQVQAAKLIDRLELLSKASTQQVALIAARLGLWDSGFSNPELGELVEVTRQILQSTGTSDAERKNILSPLYRRVALNYVNAAARMVDLDLQNNKETFAAVQKAATTEDWPKWQEKLLAVEMTIKKVRELSVLDMIEHRTIQPLQLLVRESDVTAGKTDLVSQLSDIAADITYFEANGKLRRLIDWSYLWK